MPTLPKLPTIASGPSRHVYDVVVVGGQLGGALAGALLAKRGYRILLVEHDGMGPGYEHGGFLLPYAPFITPSLKSMPAVEEAFTELGLTTTVQRTIKQHSPDLQLILEKHRVDLHHDESRRMAELAREFGQDAGALNATIKSVASFHEQSDAFFKEPIDLPPDGMMESWSVKGQIKRFGALENPPPAPSSNEISQLLFKLQPFVTYLAAPSRPIAMGRALSQVIQAPGRYPGGREGLRELLCRRLQDLGGDLLGRDASEGYIAEHLSFDGDRVAGVKLVQSETIFRGSAVIVATDAGALRRLLEEKKRHRKLTELLDLSSTKSFLFTVNWVIKADTLPRGMGELLLLETGDELGPLLIQLHAARRIGAKTDDESMRVVSAAAFVPARARDLGEDHLKSIATQISASLETLIPFARQQGTLISAPYLDAGGVRGSRLLPHPLFAIESEPLLGIEGLTQRTPVKNLFLANREVLPGLGLEGELMAGIRAARIVQETLKKRDPLKR